MRRHSHLLIDLSIAIQHHPSRAEMLPALLAAVGRAEIVEDPEPDGLASPLRTYLEALRRTPADASHRLVLQDDATVASDFRARAIRVVRERSDSLLCLFVPGVKGGGRDEVLQASARGEGFARVGVRGWIPVVATVWPVALIPAFLEFASLARYADARSDDMVAGTFARTRRLEVWATVPSLVQHADVVPSLIGRKARAGADRGRVAAVFE